MVWFYVARHMHDNSYKIVANIEFIVPVNIGFGSPKNRQYVKATFCFDNTHGL